MGMSIGNSLVSRSFTKMHDTWLRRGLVQRRRLDRTTSMTLHKAHNWRTAYTRVVIFLHEERCRTTVRLRPWTTPQVRPQSSGMRPVLAGRAASVEHEWMDAYLLKY